MLFYFEPVLRKACSRQGSVDAVNVFHVLSQNILAYVIFLITVTGLLERANTLRTI